MNNTDKNQIIEDEVISPNPDVDETKVEGGDSLGDKTFRDTIKNLPWSYITPALITLCAVAILFTLSWLYGIVGLISGLLFALGMIIPAGWYLYRSADSTDGEDEDNILDDEEEEDDDLFEDEEEEDTFVAAGIDLEGSLVKADTIEEKPSLVSRLSTGGNIVAIISVLFLSAGVVVLNPLSLHNEGLDISSNSGEDSLNGLFDNSPFAEIDDSEFDSLEQELTDQEKQEAEAKKAAQEQRAKEAKDFREKTEKTSKDIDKKIADLKKKKEKRELDRKQQAYYEHLQAQQKAAQDAQDAARRAQEEQNEKAWEDYYKRKAEYDKRMNQKNTPKDTKSTRGEKTKASPKPSTAPKTAEVKYFASCKEVIEKGLELHDGDNGYRPALDKDKNGIACDEEDVISSFTTETPSETSSVARQEE